MKAANPSRPVVSFILSVARNNKPSCFAAFFCGGVIANVVGNLPDDYWREMTTAIEPCGEPGCDCHLMRQKLLPVLQSLRDDHRATLAKKEGGFAE